ncbi:MAG TPA: efflux RND transporter permease subunit [Candidatus Acidoferrales bacterium]|nr:efflux RND transporter permease subunit [Candidatus Acidoferrales bacterium]
MWLTRFAINRPVITAMLFIALIVGGMVSYFKIGRSNNPPGTDFPIVVVFASYPGASPQEMERLVIKPIEDQLDGIDDLDQLTSTTQEGSGSVGVQFKLGTNLNIAAINVQNAVDTARVYMPVDMDPPTVYKNGASEPLLDIAISSTTLSATQLADTVNYRLEPLLKAIPNVQSVDVSGTTDREFHVMPIPGRILGTNATMLDVFAAVAANNANLPGGLFEEPTRETTVSVHAEVNKADDLLGIPLPVPGNANKALRVGDVASAEDSHVEQRAFSHFNGLPRVHVTLNRNINADEITSTQVAREQLQKIEANFPQLTFSEIDAPGDYTQKSLNGVWQSLIEGVFLTMIVMMLFLHLWRNALVVMISIPTSILATFILMNAFGFHLDSMSLMGLSLIIGILVDDSIVVLENITRHRDLGESPYDAAINGRNEIGGAAIAITLVDIVVFLPIAVMPGLVGMYLREFGAVIVIATLFSLFVSFTLTPLLAAKWSVLQRSLAPPKWLDVVKSWKYYAVLGAIAVVAFFIPWWIKELKFVIPMMCFAIAALSVFVNHYDRILSLYRTKALPWALDHGLFIVWLSVVLVVNAITLVGVSATTRIEVDGALIVVAGLAHLLGLALRVILRSCNVQMPGMQSFPEGGRKQARWFLFGPLVSLVGVPILAIIAGAILPAFLVPLLWVELGLALYCSIALNLIAILGFIRWLTKIHYPGAIDGVVAQGFILEINAVLLFGQWFCNLGRGKWVTISAFALPALLAIALPIFGSIDTDFVPAVQTGEIAMTLTYPPGTPIAVTQHYVNGLEAEIGKIDGLKSVSSTVGRKPEGWGSLTGGNYAQLNAQTLDDRRKDTNSIIEKIRKLGYLAPGGQFEVAGDSGGGSGAQIFYAISGPEDEIGPAAEKIAGVLRNTPGSVNVETSAENGAPRLNVNIDRERAAVLGISPADAATAARLAIAGGVATRVRTESGLVDVRVQLPPDQRYNVEQLGRIRVRAQDGTLVPLANVADFEWTKAPTQVKRLNRARVVNVYGGVLPGYALGSVTAPLVAKLKEPGFLPAGVTLDAQGDTQYMNETAANMSLALVTSGLLVYMLMVILYQGSGFLRALLEPLIVMFSVPCAIIGALGGLAFMGWFYSNVIRQPAGQSLNIISMIGIVMLFGLVSKNGILLVDYSNTLNKRGMRVRDAVLQSAQTRFRPILMTTCAMIFGMLPLSLGFAEGGEWRQAMGTVIIGGLASSLILTLFLVPMVYNTWIGLLERGEDRKAMAEEMKAVPSPV